MAIVTASMIIAGLVTRAGFFASSLSGATFVLSPQLPPSSEPTLETTSTQTLALVGRRDYAPSKNHPPDASHDEGSISATGPTGVALGAAEIDEQLRVTASRAVRSRVRSEIGMDPTLVGPLIRLAFHDAATRQRVSRSKRTGGGDGGGGDFIGGPNGSVRYELSWAENRALERPLGVVERIYRRVGRRDESLTEVLSFADAIALAGAQAVESAHGPEIKVRLGRVDADRADERRRLEVLLGNSERSRVDTTLPSAGLDSDGLRLYFGSLGLTEEEWVALCGAHDLGRHVTLLEMPKSCLKDLTRECLEEAPVSVPFVTKERTDTLTNEYFTKLLKWYDRNVELGEVAFVPTDVALVVDTELRKYVVRFSQDEKDFYRCFARGFVKLVDATSTSEGTY